MLQITDTLALPDREIRQRFVRATGDRRQNLTHDATAVELRLDIAKSSLPLDVRERLTRIGGKHVTDDGVLIVVARSSASQVENRDAARARLLALLRRAAAPPKIRRAVRPSRADRERRIAAKHQRAAIKRLRHV